MTRYSTSQALLLILLVFLQTSLKADSIPEIVAKAKPAIVEIVTTDAAGKPKSLGTGFFVSPDGLVVTNQHVIEGAGSISAVSINGSIFLFEHVVAQPPGVDLAVLKFQATDVPFLKLGESTAAVEGQKVIVIGNPKGLMGTVSDGLISAFRDNRSMIQITAPISHGSSGSPVMDETGQVIGVATLLSAEGQNLNFAIPVEQVSATLSAALIEPPSERVDGSAMPTPTPIQAVDAKSYLDSGIALLEKKQYEKAIHAFTEAICLDPKFASAYFYSGVAFEEEGQLGLALGDYDDAIELDPNLTRAYQHRGDVYYAQGKFDEAISDYNDAIRFDPNDAVAYYDRGNAYNRRGNIDNAISDYSDAIRLEPNNADAYGNRAKAYLRAGDRKKAEADFATEKRLRAAQTSR